MRSDINSDISEGLDDLIDILNLFPYIQLRIEVHTDTRGSASTNHTLSQQRAEAIEKYLTNQGVSENRIIYNLGFGESKPLVNCTNCSESDHKKNQRINFVIVDYENIR